MIRVGMIGCGGMGHAHGPYLAKMPNVKVVGTCALDLEKAKSLAGKIDLDRYCTDFHELLPDTENSWSSYMSEGTFGIIGTKGAVMAGNDGKMRKRIGHDGPEEIVDAEAATAIDPEGTLGTRDDQGTVRKVASRDETIQQHFFRCIEEDIEPLTSAEDGRKTLLTVMALWESSRTGKSVDVDSMANVRHED